MMNPGKLNRRVEVWANRFVLDEEGNKTYDPYGTEQTEDVCLFVMWAAVIPQTGSMLKRTAETRLSRTTHKVVCRYEMGKGIDEGCWLLYKGQRFDVLYCLNPYFANKTIEVFCEAVSEEVV